MDKKGYRIYIAPWHGIFAIWREEESAFDGASHGLGSGQTEEEAQSRLDKMAVRFKWEVFRPVVLHEWVEETPYDDPRTDSEIWHVFHAKGYPKIGHRQIYRGNVCVENVRYWLGNKHYNVRAEDMATSRFLRDVGRKYPELRVQLASPVTHA